VEYPEDSAESEPEGTKDADTSGDTGEEEL